jgi:hypothetical protein
MNCSWPVAGKVNEDSKYMLCGPQNLLSESSFSSHYFLSLLYIRDLKLMKGHIINNNCTMPRARQSFLQAMVTHGPYFVCHALCINAVYNTVCWTTGWLLCLFIYRALTFFSSLKSVKKIWIMSVCCGERPDCLQHPHAFFHLKLPSMKICNSSSWHHNMYITHNIYFIDTGIIYLNFFFEFIKIYVFI